MNRHVMLKSLLLVVLVGTIMAVTASATAYDRELVLLEVNQITYDGQPAYEYIYDLYGTPHNDWRLMGFDASQILNLYGGQLVDRWGPWSAGYPGGYAQLGWDYGPWPSFGEGNVDDTWVITPTAEQIDANNWVYDAAYAASNGLINTWHAPSEYAAAQGDDWMPGQVRTHDGVNPVGPNNFDGLYFGYFNQSNWNTTELEMTIRMVHPQGPYGTLTFYPDGATAKPVVGPGAAPLTPGDVDGDTDADVDDIDALCDFLRGESPVSGYRYDLSDDGENPNGGGGVADMNDLDYLVHYAVTTTIGNGTEYGDFNLDGLVDTTDLTRLATYFGPGTTWAEGNANRNIDLIIDTTDLTILGTYFGFDASVDVIPEPMTICVMGFGAIGLLRRRRS